MKHSWFKLSNQQVKHTTIFTDCDMYKTIAVTLNNYNLHSLKNWHLHLYGTFNNYILRIVVANLYQILLYILCLQLYAWSYLYIEFYDQYNLSLHSFPCLIHLIVARLYLSFQIIAAIFSLKIADYRSTCHIYRMIHFANYVHLERLGNTAQDN